MARLVCTQGPLEGQTFELGAGLTIGRGPHNGIPMQKDRKASRDHAKVWKSGATGFSVADLGSTNGTLVNDGKVSRTDLKDGDILQVGEAVFRFELDESERPKPKAKPKSDGGGRADLASILRGEAKPERTAAAGLEGAAAIEVKERILQYNKKDAKGTVDVAQTAGAMRYLIYIVAIALFAGIFMVAKGMFAGEDTTREGQRPAKESSD